MATTYVENYAEPLKRLHSKEISFVEFLTEVKCDKQYQKWCENHSLRVDEGSAQCFFDQCGFEESNAVKEFVEPVS